MTALNLGDDVTFHGPALPEAFVRHELEKLLGNVLPKPKAAQVHWEQYRKALRQPLTQQSGRWRVKNVVLDPLGALLDYDVVAGGNPVRTREGAEGPGLLFSGGGVTVRAFPCDFQADLDAPAEQGQTYRYTPQRIAERILLATGERLGVLTNGDELRVLLSDPARSVSFLSFRLSVWRTLSPREVPDGFRLLLAFLHPELLARQGEKPSRLEALLDAARLKQGQITRELRTQARQAVELFVQGVLDHPANRDRFEAMVDAERERLPRQLWREALIIVYRLLFILRGEASGAFRFATTSPWRNTYSPGSALADLARLVLDKGADTGQYLEQGLHRLFGIFEHGLRWTEANIAPLGGRLFGEQETPVLSACAWSEVGCARLLDKLLWTPEKSGRGGRGSEGVGRRRINYADLDVKDLGRVYEALLELEPGLATEPMVRLRRAKLEVVVPAAQGRKYRPAGVATPGEALTDGADDNVDDEEEETSGKKSKVEFVEDIVPEDGSPGKFYLRVGLGRKASGSYYTPDSFVRFLVQETLRPQVEERSPENDPQPLEILKLKVLDPAMGSGHFLVGACRFLGEKLYEACRSCADRKLWDRIPPDVVPYLPGRVQEGDAEVGVSADRARAICKRLVAVHCLYGVDKNELAVELAKVVLWLESQAEGMPLTFLDHRLVHGDSLTGPFWHNLLWHPGKADEAVKGLFVVGADEHFKHRLKDALTQVGLLEATIGANLDEVAEKQRSKQEVDAKLVPFRVAAMVWAGGVMLGERGCDDAEYSALFKHIGEHGELPEEIYPTVLAMLRRGAGRDDLPGTREALLEKVAQQGLLGGQAPALAYDLTFPEVFYPAGIPSGRQGFDAVLGNPPWDAIQFKSKEFFASYDFDVLAAPTKREREAIEQRLTAEPEVRGRFEHYVEYFEQLKRVNDRLYRYQKVEVEGDLAGRQVDAFRVFMERGAQLVRPGGYVGLLVPSAFHANEGATGVRQLYLKEMALTYCYSFENKRLLFEIHRSFKFANVVARREPAGTKEFQAAFYLHDDEWLFGNKEGHPPLTYTFEFVRKTGGSYLSLLELRSRFSYKLAEDCFDSGEPFGQVCERLGMKFGAECHMTNDAWRFTPTDQVLPDGEDPRDPSVTERLGKTGYLVLHEGKTFRQYDDHWSAPPRYLVSLNALTDKPTWLRAAHFFRAAYRNIAGPGDQNVSIWTIHPAGVITGEKGPSETAPSSRPTYSALVVVGVFNSFVIDWLLQLRVRATVSQFMLHATPFPISCLRAPSCGYLVHSALRLTCNHAGYETLWREQVGGTWHEPKSPSTWPVLATDDERWAARAVIDAVVADAYGLSREQYAHILSTFSHKTYPKAPALCLEKFDELQRIGLDAFTRKYDPYHDIPLNENLPKPVIELPSIAAVGGTLFDATPTEEQQEPGDGVKPNDRHLYLLVRVIARHFQENRGMTLGKVKAEKVAHLIEGHLGFDLGRQPVRDAAGPVDYPHLQKVCFRAEKRRIFSAPQRPDGHGSEFHKLEGFQKAVTASAETFGDRLAEVDALIDLFLPMDTDCAEIVATLYAAWNDLLAAGQEATDDRIIDEFHGWADTKQKFERDRLAKALAWMREQGLVPTGKAKPSRLREAAPPAKSGERLARKPKDADLDAELLERLKALLAAQAIVTSADVQKHLGLSAAALRPYLRKLLDSGQAVVEGKGRGVRYRGL